MSKNDVAKFIMYPYLYNIFMGFFSVDVVLKIHRMHILLCMRNATTKIIDLISQCIKRNFCVKY